MMDGDKPGVRARTYLEQAEHYLTRYKALGAEFADKDMPAEKAAEMTACWAEFERLDGLAQKATAEAEKDVRATEFEARKAGMLPPGASLPVGVGVTKADTDDAAVTITYKARGGEMATFTPSAGLVNGWTAKAEAGYTEAFRHWLAHGRDGWREGDAEQFRAKALSAGVDNAGGFWILPEVMATEIIATLADLVMMRQLGTVMPAIPVASRIAIRTSGTLDAAEWTTEVSVATADTATPAGQRALTPHPLSKLVKASNTFLAAPGANGEAYIRSQIAELFAAAEESAAMTGSGAGRWEGIFTSSLPTDVTAASATDIAYDDLVEVEGSLKSQFINGASWIMHRTIRKELLLLVDGQGLPLLRRDPAAQARFDLFGYPVNLSEYAPSSSATGQYVAALGNWKRAYRIVDSLATDIKRLDELYAGTNETGFIARKESDGMVVDGQGIVRLKMA